jgi:hypothetical protein
MTCFSKQEERKEERKEGRMEGERLEGVKKRKGKEKKQKF